MYYLYHISDQPGLSTGYIGITHRIDKRFSEHSRHQSIVGEHIREHGWTEDQFRVILVTTKEDVLRIERLLRPYPLMGLNEAPGGGMTTYTPERNAKVSASMMGNTNRAGSYPTEESRKKLSKSMMGNTNRVGSKHTEQSKQKIRQSQPSTRSISVNDTETIHGINQVARILSERTGKNFSVGNITLCCQGKRNTHHGFTFKYED